MGWIKFVVGAVLLGMLTAVSAFPEGDDEESKNECLLIARRCGTSAQSIQDKVEKLQAEIARGKKVYNPEELKALKQKLDEAEKILDFLGDQSPYINDGGK